MHGLLVILDKEMGKRYVSWLDQICVGQEYLK